MSTNASKWNGFTQFQRRVFKSRFFTVSVLAHFLFLLIFGGTVLFKNGESPDVGDITAAEGKIVEDDPDPAPNHLPQEMPTVPNMTDVLPVNIPRSTSAVDVTDAIHSLDNFDTQPVPISPISPRPGYAIRRIISTPLPLPKSVDKNALTVKQLAGIKRFTQDWSNGLTGCSPQERKFQFTAYLAKYSGGDWAATSQIQNGKITRGSLPNLLYYMNKMSRDKINAKPNAVPLDLSSDEVFAQKPPFIFFTGHRDFVLTDPEIANLQKYIRLGGCIWGDSSLPGRRSRFDIAFRREMRRVIPDSDKEWESLPSTHPMFAGSLYYSEIREQPVGINFYHEPVYALKYAGEVAVLYTANDYGDMWQVGLDDRGQVDLSRDEYGAMVATNGSLWDRRATYFRNLDQGALERSYKFGTNVIIHLLTRRETKVKNVPVGL